MRSKTALGVVIGAFCASAAMNAGVLRQLTLNDHRVETFLGNCCSNFAIDDAGTFVVAASTEDEGGNPNNDARLVGWTLPGEFRSEIVPFPVLLGDVSVSDDGQWIAFVAAADPVAQNADRGMEVFLASRDGTVRQLTHRSFKAPNPRPVLSGSANRVLFLDNGNPLGTNPAGLMQLFVIDASGLNLRQLTAVTDPAKSFCNPDGIGVPTHAVDDAGRRVVFAHDGNLTGANAGGKCQLYRVGADGNVLTQITSGNVDSYWPVLSGNGVKAVYWIEATRTLHMVDYLTAVSTQLVTGSDASITDDGAWVYYLDDSQVFKIPSTGGAATQLTATEQYLDNPRVSGANTAVVMWGEHGALPGGDNPDGSAQIWVTDVSGNNVQQLTDNDTPRDFDYAHYFDPDMPPDGSRVVFISLGEIHRVNADGSHLERLSFAVGNGHDGTAAEHQSVGQDGDTIVFESWLLEPPGAVPRIYALRDDGSELLLASDGAGPVLGKTSNLAVFQGASAGGPGPGQLFKVQADTFGSTQFTSDGENLRKFPRLDYAAEWVVYESRANPLGTNVDGSSEIFRVRTDGSGLQQLTSAPSGYSGTADISADGSRVVFVSTTNPVGLNPDANEEIFLLDISGGAMQQLTLTTGVRPVGFATMPRISGNGEYVFFRHPWLSFEYPSALYRMELATGHVERCDGIPEQPLGGLVQYNYTAGMAVDYTGSRVAFVSRTNGTGQNGDGSDEVFYADFAASPRWTISKSQPTVLSFEPDPRGVRYDVLRGDLANLAPGPDGTVDLGPVVCLENDSWDASTLGFGDPTMPVPGQGFFFLYRFTQGPPDGSGSWGQGTGGAEHVPGFGACPD